MRDKIGNKPANDDDGKFVWIMLAYAFVVAPFGLTLVLLLLGVPKNLLILFLLFMLYVVIKG